MVFGMNSVKLRSSMPHAPELCAQTVIRGWNTARNCTAPGHVGEPIMRLKAGVRKTVKDSDVHQIARCHGRFCSKLVMGLIPLLGGAMLVSASLLEQAGTAEIVDSGSTNTSGFRIVVDRSGQADYKTTTRKNAPQTDERSVNKHRQISRELVDRFYSDLEAAKPLSSLPEQRCMKSASFGTTMSIEFAGEKTPDLNCGDGGDPKLQAIIRDTNDIVQLFGTNEHVAPPRKPQ